MFFIMLFRVTITCQRDNIVTILLTLIMFQIKQMKEEIISNIDVMAMHGHKILT